MNTDIDFDFIRNLGNSVEQVTRGQFRRFLFHHQSRGFFCALRQASYSARVFA